VSSTFGRVGYSEWLASSNPMSTAAINGAGSTWTNSGELLVGGYSDGAMTISGAGSVSSHGGAIGDGAGISSEVANVLLVGSGSSP
jgi:fibronectin-binding autotransporter adhesin